MCTGWLMLLTVVEMVSLNWLPLSVTMTFLTWFWASSHSENFADLMPAFLMSEPSELRRSACSLVSAWAIDTLPLYSVTGTPSMVPVPTFRTLVAPANS